MSKLSVKGQVFDVDVVVFDKDGLLFDSVIFWIELAKARLKAALEYMDKELALKWLELMDVEAQETDNGEIEILRADPIGVMAVASPDEETMISATFLLQNLGLRWPQARAMAQEIFQKGDQLIDLTKGIRPKPGFPGIFQRLWQANIPFGIATSDDLERARRSVDMFDDFSHLSFVVTPKDVVHNKPERDMLDLIANKFQVPTQKIMMLGDSYVDVMMAKAADSVGVGIPEFTHMRKKMEPYATVIADTLDDIVILPG